MNPTDRCDEIISLTADEPVALAYDFADLCAEEDLADISNAWDEYGRRLRLGRSR